MPLLYRLTFMPGGRTQDFSGSRGNYYRLDGGARIPLRSVPVWCGRCATVTHGEEIESVAAIDKYIADLERLAAEIRRDMTRPPLPPPDAPGDRYQQEQIAELRLRRAWRVRRTSPPKCLTCGTTAVVPLAHGRPVRVDGGSVRCEALGLSSSHFSNMYFSPEGDLIGDGSPT